MRYKVEISGKDFYDLNFPWSAHSLSHAVKLFRKAVERGDYYDGDTDRRTITATVEIWGEDFDDGGFFNDLIDSEEVTATYKGKE